MRAALIYVGVSVVVVFGCVSVGVASPARDAARSHGRLVRCAPRHPYVHIVHEDRQAQIYWLYEGEEVRGCLRGHKHSVLLGDGEHCVSDCVGPEIDHVRLAGTFAGYEEWSGGGGTYKYYIVERSLRDGSVLRKVPNGERLKQPSPEDVGSGETTALVVKSDGPMAWIAIQFEQSFEAPWFYEVHVLDSTGSRVVASGRDIRPRSLTLRGSTVYWKQAGKIASALLQ